MQSSTWSSMVSGPEDDFSNFLFGDLQLDFPTFDSNPQDGEEIQDGAGPAMQLHSNNNAGGLLGFQHGGVQQFADSSGLGDFNGSPHVFPDMELAPELFDQQQQHLHQMTQSRSYGQPYHGHIVSLLHLTA